MKQFFSFSTLLLLFSFCSAQVGVITYDGSIDKYYTLFSNTFGNESYLIDNCGRLVNKWTSEKDNGLSAAILPDGRLIRAYKETGSNIYQPSIGGGLEIRNWDGELQWQYKEAGEGYVQHHDFAVMPNGNILFIGWEAITTTALEEMGMNTENVYTSTVWFEYIKEIKPIGSETELIWEWHMIDHIVQDLLPDIETYGVIQDNPHKFDINFTSPLQFSVQDPFHANAIDYNPLRDEIVLNLRSIGELWILDHSTTSLEASGETGGNSGKGGDILFRWGNPQSYDRQIQESDWTLFGAHGVNFVDEGLPDEGKIVIFNNGVLRPEGSYATIEMIDPLLDVNDQYLLNSDGQFDLIDHKIIYGENGDLISEYQSNAHQLPNGDFFINAADIDRMLQVNEAKEILWEYQIPLNNGFPLNQSDNDSYFLSFMSFRYPADYEGFQNIDLSPGELIEQNVTMDFCAILPQKELYLEEIDFKQNSTEIILKASLEKDQLRLISADGQYLKLSSEANGFETKIDLTQLRRGVYYLQVFNSNKKLYTFPFIHLN